MMYRIPSPDQYRALPFAERLRLYRAVVGLLLAWAETERPA
jgi:hypothetical protein